MGGDYGEGLAELAADPRGGGEHQRDEAVFDQCFFGVGDGGGGGGGPAGAEMVLEVDGGGEADLVVGGGLGDEAEDGEGEAGLVRGFGEGGFGGAAGGGEGGEGEEEPVGEGF